MRMERQLIRLATGILWLFVFVFGCAGPVYQARYDYLPPESSGRQVVHPGVYDQENPMRTGGEQRIRSAKIKYAAGISRMFIITGLRKIPDPLL